MHSPFFSQEIHRIVLCCSFRSSNGNGRSILLVRNGPGPWKALLAYYALPIRCHSSLTLPPWSPYPHPPPPRPPPVPVRCHPSPVPPPRPPPVPRVRPRSSRKACSPPCLVSTPPPPPPYPPPDPRVRGRPGVALMAAPSCACMAHARLNSHL